MKNFRCPECGEPECNVAHFWMWGWPLLWFIIGIFIGLGMTMK